RVRHLVGEDAVLVDAVLRDVRSEVGARRHADGLRRADVGHFQERARARVALAEEQEIVGGVPREHREVRLDEVLPQAGRDTRELAPPDVLPDLPGVARVDGHGRILLRARPARSARSRRSALRVVCSPSTRPTRRLPLRARVGARQGASARRPAASRRRPGAPRHGLSASIAFPASQGPYNWFHLLWRAAEVRAPSASAAVATAGPAAATRRGSRAPRAADPAARAAFLPRPAPPSDGSPRG